MTMSLVGAFQILATAWCRFSVQPPTGRALEVPAGAEVPAAVLETLAAHREEIAAAMGLSFRQVPLVDEGAGIQRVRRLPSTLPGMAFTAPWRSRSRTPPMFLACD
jgi:hypothetical protein